MTHAILKKQNNYILIQYVNKKYDYQERFPTFKEAREYLAYHQFIITSNTTYFKNE